MAEINQDFEMYAGETKNVEIVVSNADLTGATVKWALKKRVSSAENITYKDSASGGITITNATGGVFLIALIPEDTTSLVGMYYHEAEVIDASGNVSTVTTGNVVIKQSGV